MKPDPNLYLVTGASGFLGTALVEHLTQSGQRVRAMVRDEGKAGRLRELGAEIAVADMRDANSLSTAVDGVTGIYHIAAMFREAKLGDEVYHDVNVDGPVRLMDAAIAAGAKRFVHCSTVGVLGNVIEGPAREDAPYAPQDTYQSSKMEGEKRVLAYLAEGKIGGAVIRPAMIYGPHDRRTLKLFKMIHAGFFFYVGKGNALVHWVDVRDLARSFDLAMHDGRNGELYIIAGRRAMPLKELTEIIADVCGVRRPWIHFPYGPMMGMAYLCEAICRPLGIEPPLYPRRVRFYHSNRHFDSSKAKEQLGYEPAQDAKGEVEDIVASYREDGSFG